MADLVGEHTLYHDTVLTAVVNQLRKLILTHQIKPGTRLVQGELASQFGVSRTPIREALHQLATEGLVTLSPYRGASVVALSVDEMQAIYHVRIALEGYAARLVAEHITDDEIASLKMLLEDMKQAFEHEEPDELLRINRHFYLHFYRTTKQPRLYEMIMNHIDLSQQYRRLYFYQKHLAANTIAEHEQILGVIAQHDADEAERILREGLAATAVGLIHALRQAEATD